MKPLFYYVWKLMWLAVLGVVGWTIFLLLGVAAVFVGSLLT